MRGQVWSFSLLFFGACASPSWADDPRGPLPERLSAVGVYPDTSDLTRLHPRAIAYEPAYPLWSNGSDKQRFVLLPEGERVDSSDPGAWAFPVGTLLVKTFSYAGVPAETRIIRHAEDGWELAAYAWDADGRDATLLDGDQSTPVTVSDGTTFEHEIPSERQCRTCHEANVAMVIGFSELQLAADPGTLDALAERDVFSDPVPDAPDRIEGHDAVTTEVLGYLQGNCVHCHNGIPGPANAFDMRHRVALDNLVGVMTTSSAVEPGLRVAPGAPDESALFRLFTGASDLAMPPLGVQRRDDATADLFRTWIASLE